MPVFLRKKNVTSFSKHSVYLKSFKIFKVGLEAISIGHCLNCFNLK